MIENKVGTYFNFSARQFFLDLLEKFEKGVRVDKSQIRQLSTKYGIQDIARTYELAEIAWIMYYRSIVDEGDFDQFKRTIFDPIKNFYVDKQPRYNERTSIKIQYQQYSTPAPLAVLAGWFCDAHKAESIFEPSAGNGLMTIAAPMEKTTVNELEVTRVANLSAFRFKEVTNLDASEPFLELQKKFDVVLTNPPFGQYEGSVYSIYKQSFTKLDFVMVAHALSTMKDNGKAAFIIGGNLLSEQEWDKISGVKLSVDKTDNGFIVKHKGFWVWLFNNYNVVDILNIKGALYDKQGTTYPIRMVLINGRNKNFDRLPTVSDKPHFFEQLTNFEDIYKRVEAAKNNKFKPQTIKEAAAKIKAILSIIEKNLPQVRHKVELSLKHKALIDTIIGKSKFGDNYLSVVQTMVVNIFEGIEQINKTNDFQRVKDAKIRALIKKETEQNDLPTLNETIKNYFFM